MYISFLPLHRCSPAIVGMLWDVTDRDIDRFGQSLLDKWLDNGNSADSSLGMEWMRGECGCTCVS